MRRLTKSSSMERIAALIANVSQILSYFLHRLLAVSSIISSAKTRASSARWRQRTLEADRAAPAENRAQAGHNDRRAHDATVFDAARERRLFIPLVLAARCGCGAERSLPCGGARSIWTVPSSAFVEPAAILELAVGIVNEKVRRTDRPIRPCDYLRLVVKIGKRQIMNVSYSQMGLRDSSSHRSSKSPQRGGKPCRSRTRFRQYSGSSHTAGPLAMTCPADPLTTSLPGNILARKA